MVRALGPEGNYEDGLGKMVRRSGDAGFEELQHTADCAVRVWAPTLAALFREAARAMNAVAGARIRDELPVKRKIALTAPDPEGLLVEFLTGLLICQEQENLAFADFDLQVGESQLAGDMWGSHLEALAKPLKAVTYHNLNIRRPGRRWQVEIVFDV
jgi:protein archease